MKIKRVIYPILALVSVFCLCLAPSALKTRAQDGGGSSRDVIPPTTYITGDQAHARLFKYNNAIFTNISAANQNISPEVNAVAWNDSYWAMVARGRLWRSDNGIDVTEVLTPDPVTPSNNIYPYVAIASNGALGKWLAGTLMGRGMYYDGINTPSAYHLSNSDLTAEVDNTTVTFPVQDGTKFKHNDVVQVSMEYCLVDSVAGNDLTVVRGYNPMTGGSDPSQAFPHPGWDGDINVRVAFADIVSVDWDGNNGRWIIGALTPDFSTHLFATDATGLSTDLTDPDLPGISNLKGDYRVVGGLPYYLVGGKTLDGTASKLYTYNDITTFTDITDQIPNMNQGVTVITGGTNNWLVGGQGSDIVAGHLLYSVSESEGVFTETPITVPAGPTGLASVTAIGYGGGNNWLIGGTDSAGMARLYSYNAGTFSDLTAHMQEETQAAITTINSIAWNGSYWLIGGAGEFNVSPDVGGSVAAPDPDNEGQPGNDAKVAFTGGTVDHDSSVRVNEVSAGIASDASLKPVGSTYDFTCQDLLTNSLVAQFDKSVTINLSYDPTQLGDKPESSLTIAYYDAASGKWMAASSTVDTTNKIVTATVNHFTQFGVFSSELPYTGN
ncbi:MAG: hypothetical protein NT039_02415 [Candidatus Berkelbacteria bacterium]|nr:hypothetical protein [Candidatus Berkelbacteria bacterium]